MSAHDISIEGLTAEERLELIERLWDSLAVDPDTVPIPEWHLRIIEERVAELDGGEVETVPWEEVRRHLLSRYK